MKNLEELRARMGELREEILGLAEAEELTEVQAARYDEANAEFDAVRTESEELEARDARLEELRSYSIAHPAAVEAGEDRGPEVIVRDSNPFAALDEVRAFDAPEVRSRKLRDAAMRAIEGATEITADQQTEAERKLAIRGVDAHILATGSDEYKRGWAKAVCGQSHMLTNDEQRALSRAMSLTDASGGYLVPFTLDPTVILTNDGSSNPYRQISRVVTTTTDTWSGVTTAGVTASWDSEGTEVSDDAPTLAQPTITPAKAAAFVPVSFEAFEDIAGLAQEVVMMFADAKDRLEEAAFATGDGSSKPWGVSARISATTGSRVSATTDNSFGVEDIYKLIEALPPRFRANASFVANLSIIDKIRQFGTSNNYSGFTTDLTGSGVPALIGKPVYESNTMDGTIGTGNDDVLLVGDFSNYIIVDRVGLSVDFIPNLFSTSNGRPTGQRGWYAHWRVGADVASTAAFRQLRV
jgi:HK97 family phage major capsid protein